jgi:acyl-coenzyme A synthetase/AMP-(fatty) acid ligase
MSGKFRSTAQYLSHHARQQPEAIAIIRDGASLTYREFADQVVQFTKALQEFPITPGMLVGIECQNRITHLLLMMACAQAGAATISMVRNELQLANPFFGRCDFVFSNALPEIPGNRPGHVISPDWQIGVGQRLLQPADRDILDVPHDPRQVARIVRTSGTTGRPKVMALTHGTVHNYIAQYGSQPGEQIPSPPRFILLYDFPAQFACHRAYMTLQMGGTIIFSTHAAFLQDLQRYRANYTMLLVADAERMISQIAQMPEPFSKPEIFGMATAGAGLSARLREALLDKLASHLVDIYAANETGRICVTGDNGIGTMPDGVAVAIVDDHGDTMPAGEVGRIKVRSGVMIAGYLDDPTATSSAFVDGWFHINDFGMMPATGQLVVMGRADDMLNLGGFKVAPELVENKLKAIGGVQDAVVLSIENERGVGRLAVVIEADVAGAKAPLKTAISDAVRQTVGSCHLVFTAALPRTETGKVKRRVIATALAGAGRHG